MSFKVHFCILQEPVVREAFGQDFPSFGQIAKSIALMFVNSNPFLELPRPSSNKIVHIGGLVDSKVGKLDQVVAKMCI